MTACSGSEDSPPTPPVVETGTDEVAVDSETPDTAVDSEVPDTAIDSETPEVAVDSGAPDTAVDSAVTEAAADSATIDSAPTDVGAETAPDTVAPSIAFTSPTTSGTYFTASSVIAIAGTASDDVGVKSVTWKNAAYSSLSGTATGTTSWSVPSVLLMPGGNPVSVTATDAAGNTKSALLIVTRDNDNPFLAITSPTSAAIYTTGDATITLAGNASDATSGIVSASWANSTLGVSGAATGTYSWFVSAIPLASGTNTLVITVTDGAGNTSSRNLYVTRDASGPVVAITSPTSAAKYTASTTTVSLSGTATDSTSVAFLSWSNTTTGASGSVTGLDSWSTPAITLGAGKNTIVVTAYDTFGNSASDSLEVYACNATTFPGYTSFTATTNGHCLVKSGTAMSRDTAQTTCAGFGGALATITDATENTSVSAFGTADRWIGLNDLTTEGTFEWPTGEAFSYTNWAVAEPANTAGDDCVKMVSGGKWAVTTCAASLAAVCEIAP